MLIEHDPQADQQHIRDMPEPTPSRASAPSSTFILAYGRFVYRFRWVIIAFWSLLLAGSIPFALTIADRLQTNLDLPVGSESSQVNDLLVSLFHQAPTQLLVAFHSDAAIVSDPAYQTQLQDFTQRAQGFAHVTGVQSGVPSQDGHTMYAIVGFDQSPDAVGKALPTFRRDVVSPTSSGPATISLTGSSVINQEILQITFQDLQRIESVTLAITLIVLLLVFGSLIAASMPLLLALSAIVLALALLSFVSHVMPIQSTVIDIASVIGLGLAIDYSLFLIRRFREELAMAATVEEAVSHTITTAGQAIFFSGVTVIIAFSGLLLLQSPIMTSIGVGGALTVGCAVLAGLTLLPAVLGILGTRINTLQVPILGPRTLPHPDQDTNKGFWHWLAQTGMRYPLLFIVLVLAVIGALARPAADLNIGSVGINGLPPSSEGRQAFTLLSANYPNLSPNTFTVVARTADGSAILTPENLAQVVALSQWISSQSQVTGMTSVVLPPSVPGQPALTQEQLLGLYETGQYQQSPTLSRFVQATTQGDATLIAATSDLPIDSGASKELLTTLRNGTGNPAPDLRLLVGGAQAQSVDTNKALYSRFPWTFAYILLATYLLLMLMLRSVVLPLEAAVMTLLSVGAAFGAVIYIFQQGHFQRIFHITSTGSIDNTLPILLFCVLFGLSMDYELFLVSRIREEWRKSGKNREAVAHGIEHTGGVITSAALLFVIIAGGLTFSSIEDIQEIGFGLAVAVLVDAFLIRSLLVPSVMRILGSANWWLPFARTRKKAN